MSLTNLLLLALVMIAALAADVLPGHPIRRALVFLIQWTITLTILGVIVWWVSTWTWEGFSWAVGTIFWGVVVLGVVIEIYEKWTTWRRAKQAHALGER